MVLDAENRVRFVLHAHNKSVVSLTRDLKACRTGGPFDDQAVVPRCDERIRHIFIDTGSFVMDPGYFAVHEIRCANHLAAESKAYGLVAEADA